MCQSNFDQLIIFDQGSIEGQLRVLITGIDLHLTMDASSTHDLSTLPPGWDVSPLQDI